ncbi:MAG: Imm21 family immunity protein, partial [Verrucomicrobiota bacterium]
KLVFEAVLREGRALRVPNIGASRRFALPLGRFYPLSTSRNQKYQYLACDAGPHILVPRAVSAKWKGHEINLTNPLDPSTDYGRACAVTGKWGIISVAGSNALVLANPPMSACKPDLKEEPIEIYVLQAWSSTNLDELLDRAITHTPSEGFANTGAKLTFDGSGGLLLYAGDKPGDPNYGESVIPTKAATYSLFTAHYEGRGVDEVDIYRLILEAQPSGAANGSRPVRSETN